ncbi:60S acidic ribosomal protein P2-like [Puma concolor]|uniref:60S acidic ribosomal protein P2-like n=1 Tax=Puma concolor TaxID=9696 RepID=A0A6P6I233_PUMCO|nr:60S acidic ribosomal protein P2-like [Puma concolor]
MTGRQKPPAAVPTTRKPQAKAQARRVASAAGLRGERVPRAGEAAPAAKRWAGTCREQAPEHDAVRLEQMNQTRVSWDTCSSAEAPAGIHIGGPTGSGGAGGAALPSPQCHPPPRRKWTQEEESEKSGGSLGFGLFD